MVSLLWQRPRWIMAAALRGSGNWIGRGAGTPAGTGSASQHSRHVETGLCPSPRSLRRLGTRAIGAQYNRRQAIFQAMDCYALPNGIATNLVAPPDFMRSNIVCFPSLSRSASCLRISARNVREQGRSSGRRSPPYLGRNASSLSGDVSMGDVLGSLITMKPTPDS
jgi:hypothetical protein